jgi:hypothetical protein
MERLTPLCEVFAKPIVSAKMLPVFKHTQLSTDTRATDPTLWQIFKYLNMEIAPADHSLSFSQVDADKIDAKATMKVPPLIHPLFSSRNFVFTVPFTSSHVSLALPLPSLATISSVLSFTPQWIKLYLHSKLLLASNTMDYLHETTLEEYLQQQGYTHDFIWGFVYPGMATVCSCSIEALKKVPASYILHFHANHGRSAGWSCLKSGVHEFCSALLSNVDSVFLGRGVAAVYRNTDTGVPFEWIVEDENGVKEFYNQVCMGFTMVR